MKQLYKVGFKSLIREKERACILRRQYNLESFKKFSHKGASRILILIQGDKK